MPNLQVPRNIAFREETQLKILSVNFSNVQKGPWTCTHGHLSNLCSHIRSNAPDPLYLESWMNLGTRFFFCVSFVTSLPIIPISFSRFLASDLSCGVCVEGPWPSPWTCLSFAQEPEPALWDCWDIDLVRHNAGIVPCTPPADCQLCRDRQGWSPLNNCSTNLQGNLMIPTNSSGGMVHTFISFHTSRSWV